MKFFSALLILSSLNLNASECEVELFNKVYRLTPGQVLQARDLVRTTTCSPEISNKITSLISESEGSVGSDFLTSELKKEFSNTTIHFPVKKLSLLDFGETLRSKILPETNLYFTQTRSLNGLSSIGLIEGEQIRPICDSCQSFGEKNIKIDITNILENSSRSLWFSSKIMAKIKVVKAKRNISFQQKFLDPKDFYFDEILTMSPDNVLTSLDNIHFYKVNKNILQNTPISNLDLQALNLVNYGSAVNVTLSNQNISLQKMAMPARSARFGESVELKVQNNKIITGKVVDYNKVVIEL